MGLGMGYTDGVTLDILHNVSQFVRWTRGYAHPHSQAVYMVWEWGMRLHTTDLWGEFIAENIHKFIVAIVPGGDERSEQVSKVKTI